MARELRVQYVGAVYHVINRGDRRQSSFKDESRFVGTLGESCLQTGCLLVSGAGERCGPARIPGWCVFIFAPLALGFLPAVLHGTSIGGDVDQLRLS